MKIAKDLLNVEGLCCDTVLDGGVCTSVNLSAEVLFEARSQIGHENHPKRSWASVENDGEGHAGLESCNLRFWDLVANADIVAATRDLGGRLEATLFVVGANCGGDLFTASYGCFGDDGWEYTDRESNQAAFEVPAHSCQTSNFPQHNAVHLIKVLTRLQGISEDVVGFMNKGVVVKLQRLAGGLTGTSGSCGECCGEWRERNCVVLLLNLLNQVGVGDHIHLLAGEVDREDRG
ncbi:hypothetical protein HG530_007999 [Fusarium avenaceum]|nr:hypothetical protein HG530_007999 [Fusarium avenaceum]